jgi:hypothetical protein
LGVAAGAVLVAAPIYAVSIVVINANNKREISTEFSRRRLVLPATLAPGQTVQGSLFFRISPGPQRLVVQGRNGGTPFEFPIELSPLWRLHMREDGAGVAPPKPPAPATAPKS